jgi:hypothetical protein
LIVNKSDSNKRLTLDTRILVTDVESLSPRIKSNFPTEFFFELATGVSRYTQQIIPVGAICEGWSRIGHPPSYNREKWEKALGGGIIYMRRLVHYEEPKKTKGPNNTLLIHNVTPEITSEFLYLLQSTFQGDGLVIGLRSLHNHTEKAHYVNTRLLKIDYERIKPARKSKS